jgi:hypothetical protein
MNEPVFGVIDPKRVEELLCIQKDFAVLLGSTSGLNDAFELLLQTALRMEAVDSGGVYLVDEKSCEWRPCFCTGLSPWFIECVARFGIDALQSEPVVHGKPVYWSKEDKKPSWMESLFERENIRSLAVVPVRSGQRVIAVLNLASRTHAAIPEVIRSALDAIAAQTGGTVARLQAEEALKEERFCLEEDNTALRILLEQLERDREAIRSSVLDNLKTLVMPFLEKLKRINCSEEQLNYIEAIETHLQNIASPLVMSLTDRFLGLTPTEIRVAEMVKTGKTNKDIAHVLRVSEGTVRSHREHLRGKLGLKNSKINLRSYLQSL